MKYEIVIGLEVHIELSTESKLFCSCSAKFGAGENENICPACAGMPGMPAVLNKKAVELAIAAAILTNSDITPVMTFDKKNYFYPDLPAGYQITQWFAPICKNGWVDIETENGQKRITLKQIHIEEDAGKQIHDPYTHSTLVDYNRTSVPLIEVVSNPDFRNAEEVTAYLEKLRSLFSFAGVSDCKMQEGSMRCDINISVREAGILELGTRTEMKNMNSLKAITRAISFESQRHIDALVTGREELIQETRRWDDELGESFSMREKETAADYRYFPNPEIMPVSIGENWIQEINASLPEQAADRYRRMTETLSLPAPDCRIVTGSLNLSKIFEQTISYYDNPREAVNWITGDLLNVTKTAGIADDEIVMDCAKFATILKLVDDKIITRATGKKLLKKVYEEDVDPEAYISENALVMVSDEGFLETVVRDVLADNGKTVGEYKAGSQKVFGFLVGQVMKKTAGKADPATVNELLKKMLDGL